MTENIDLENYFPSDDTNAVNLSRFVEHDEGTIEPTEDRFPIFDDADAEPTGAHVFLPPRTVRLAALTSPIAHHIADDTDRAVFSGGVEMLDDVLHAVDVRDGRTIHQTSSARVNLSQCYVWCSPASPDAPNDRALTLCHHDGQVNAGAGARLRGEAFKQLCKTIGLPHRFALKMPFRELTDAINGLLNRTDKRVSLRMVRPDGSDLPEIRSIQSTTYADYGTTKAVEAVMNTARTVGIPGLEEATFTADFGRVDRVRVITDAGALGPDGLRLQYGFEISNGEIGNASTRVNFLAHRPWCSNGCHALQRESEVVRDHRKRYTSADYQIRLAMRAFDRNCLEFQRAASVAHGFKGSVQEIDKLLARKTNLDTKDRQAVIGEMAVDKVAREHGAASRQDVTPDMVRAASDLAHDAIAEFTGYDAVQGITGVARDRGPENSAALEQAAPALLASFLN